MTTRHFIIAESLKAADADATINQGWIRVREGRWKLPDGSGDEVDYIDQPDRLRGARNVRLYMGLNWFDNRGGHRVLDEARARQHFGIRIVQMPWTPPQGAAT